MKKYIIVISVILLILFSGKFFLWWIYKEWNTSDPRAENFFYRNQYKSIRFENLTDSAYTILTDFRYRDEDSLNYSKSKMDSLSYFNKIDTNYVYMNTKNGTSTRNKTSTIIPIFRSDVTKFPKKFNVKIYNRDRTYLIKELNLEDFINYVMNKNNNVENFRLESESWTLIIDSTLLDLKK